MEHKNEKSVVEIIKFTIIAVLIIILVRTYIAQPFIVSGQSMDPTFKSGEYLIVDELSYKTYTNPKRDDVIVFKYPNEPRTYFIKRIIGLPGETVKIKDGHISVIDPVTKVEKNLTENFIDPKHYLTDNKETTLGENQYFVMGDNRAESLDSRAWGPLDKKFIVGKPLIRLLPLSRISIFPGKSN